MRGAQDWRDGALSDMVKIRPNDLDDLAISSMAFTNQRLAAKPKGMLSTSRNRIGLSRGVALDLDQNVESILRRHVSTVSLRSSRGHPPAPYDRTDVRTSSFIPPSGREPCRSS